MSQDYVPMAPMVHRGNFSDYVPMDCKQRSMESGTPTNSPYCDVHFEKVCTYLTPSEDKEPIIRPARAYSVGSRPDGLREKIEKYIVLKIIQYMYLYKHAFFLEFMLIDREDVHLQLVAMAEYRLLV